MDFAPPSPSKIKYRNSEELILEDLFINPQKGHDKNVSLLNTTSPSKPGSSTNVFKKLQYSDKSVFKGQISANNVPDGIGRLELDNGDYYEGEFKDGMFEGRGRLKMAEGKLYEGEWRMNMREGKGREVWSDGKIYEGEFKKDQKNGYGKTIML